MKIDKLSNTSFYGKEEVVKKRFLTPYAQKDVQKLMRKMNYNTIYTENEAHTEWTSEILARISVDKKYNFIDHRMYIAPIEKPQEFDCDCTLEMGKTKLNINSTTGEIVSFKKSFFRTWRSVYKQAESCLKGMLSNFDNPEVVKKHSFGISDFTKKGFEILKDASKHIKYYRNL